MDFGGSIYPLVGVFQLHAASNRGSLVKLFAAIVRMNAVAMLSIAARFQVLIWFG